MRQCFTTRQHLTRTLDYTTVRHAGKQINSGEAFLMQVWVRPHLEGQPPLRRLGVIASRKVGSAVRRNRAKRLFREIFRLNQEALPHCCDMVVTVRLNFGDYSFQELQARYLQACQKAFPKKATGG